MQRIVRVSTLMFIAVLTGAAPAAAQSAPPNEIVISEFRVRGPVGGNDEFVELRNRSAAPVEILGWRLQGCQQASPGTPATRVTVGSDVFLPAGGSYLFANNGYSGSVTPDQTYGTGITDFLSGNFAGVRIVDASSADGVVRDGAGSPNSPCREGSGMTTPASPLNGDYSFERRLSGTMDTNDNVPDFEGPKPGHPQNSGGNTTG